MKFSDTSNKNGLIQLVERLCKLGDGGVTNDSTLFAQVTADINQAYMKVGSALLMVDKNWRWDDYNFTDFPIGTATLVNNQRDYALPVQASGANPSTLWKIYKVRILDTNGDWVTLEAMYPGEEEGATAGMPTKYKPLGNSIRFNVPVDTSKVTATNGLQIWFQRSFDAFTVSDTTQEPGFPNIYHDLLGYDAASTYLLPYDPQLATLYQNIFLARLEEMKSFWANRNDDAPRRMSPLVENTK